MHKAQLREIVKQDNARRAARRLLEDATLGINMIEDALSDASKIAANNTRGAYVNPCLVRGIGTVNPPMPTSASRNTWDAFKSARVGVAPGTEETSKVPTVLVTYADGTSEVKPVSAFSTPKNTSQKRKQRTDLSTQAQDALYEIAHHTTEAAHVKLDHDFTS